MDPIYVQRFNETAKALVLEGATRLTIFRQIDRKHTKGLKEGKFRRIKVKLMPPEFGEHERTILLAGIHAYNVFNADQVGGYNAPIMPELSEAERIAEADRFFAAIPAEITHGGNSAFYVPSADRVQMVPFSQFENARAYYAVLAHELTHWTGAKARLDRDLSGRFGTESYAVEELVAELGAAFLSGQLGLPSVPRTDHASISQHG